MDSFVLEFLTEWIKRNQKLNKKILQSRRAQLATFSVAYTNIYLIPHRFNMNIEYIMQTGATQQIWFHHSKIQLLQILF